MAKSLGRYTPQSESAPVQAVEVRGLCVANGCPALAGIAYGAEGKAVCRFHAGTKREAWDRITSILRRWGWLVCLADFVASREWTDANPDWPERAAAACERNDSPDMTPRWTRNLGGRMVHEREHPVMYAQRMSATLGTLVADVRAESIERASQRHAEHLAQIATVLRMPQDPELRAEREAIQAESA